MNGPVTNATGGLIRANYNPVLFTGAVVNNGTIKVNGAPTNTVTFASSYSGSGTYVSDPADNYFQDVNVTAGGSISGAAGDRFFVNGTYTNAAGATYLNAGGTLSAQDVVNHGQFIQSGGVATMRNLTGTGSLTVGGAGTARVTVASIQQSAVMVNGGATLAIATNPTRLTHNAGSLSIAAGGAFDLGNQNLLTTTAVSTVRQWLVNGYNNGAWNGTATGGGVGAIMSTAANAASLSDQRSLGYASAADVAAGLVSPTAAGQIGAGQTLVQYTTPADFNLDGRTDFNDFLALQNHYNQSGDWAAGDANYDGVVNFNDFLVLQNNYNHQLPALGAGPTVAGEAMLLPEPAGVAWLGGIVVATLGRRRGRRRDGSV